jgi:hypothetical protein
LSTFSLAPFFSDDDWFAKHSLWRPEILLGQGIFMRPTKSICLTSSPESFKVIVLLSDGSTINYQVGIARTASRLTIPRWGTNLQ